mgnify:CR=1 FL=1
MLPKVAEHVKDHGLPLEKLHIVPNGICGDEWNNETPISNELKQIIEKEKQEEKN